MDFKHYMSQSFREGKEAGLREKEVEAARNLYANDVSIEIIAKSLNMSENEVREIVNKPAVVDA